MFDAIDLPKLTSVLGGCNMGSQPQPDPRAAARGGTPPPGGQETGDAPDGQVAAPNPGGSQPAQPAPGGATGIDGCELGKQLLALISNFIQQFAAKRQA